MSHDTRITVEDMLIAVTLSGGEAGTVGKKLQVKTLDNLFL